MCTIVSAVVALNARRAGAFLVGGPSSSMDYLLAAGNTQPGGFYSNPSLGEDTQKLFFNFVEHSVNDTGDAAPPRRASLPQAPPRRAYAAVREVVPEPTPTPAPAWKVTEDMMHQPWGAVLRVLQPRSTNSVEAVIAMRRGGR